MQHIKVLFVCLGNICRSPIAHGVMDFAVKVNGLANVFEIDSAGTTSFHTGEEPDIRSLSILKKNGIYINHKARQITTADILNFNYIIAMDHLNYDELINLANKHPENRKKIFLLRSFDLTEKTDFDIPDPYYGLDDDFEEVFTICKRSVIGFLNFLYSQKLITKINQNVL